MPIVLFAPRPARSIRTRTMPSIALASVAGVRPTAVLPARGIQRPGGSARRLAAKISTRSSLCRGAVYFPSRHHHARRVASRPLAASGGADGGNVDDDVDALSSRLESLKAKSRSMLEEASQLEAGIDASENDEVISESTRIKRSPSRSASGLPVGKMGVADAVAGIPSPSQQSQQSQPPQPPTTNALLAGVVAVGGLAAAGAASAAGVAAGSEPVLAIVGAAAGFALLKTGQLIGSNLKEKAVPALGKQEAKAREKAGGYVAPKQAAAATVIDEKKAAAKAASDSAMKSKSKSVTASNDADAILAASSFVGASDLDKARLRRALRTIASTQKATSVSTSAASMASTSVPAGYVNNEQERKIYEIKKRSKELGTLNEFLDKYGPPDEVYGRAKAEKAVERQAAELIAPGNVTWKPRETWLKVILWDCVCYPLQVPFLFLAWALGFSWGTNPPPPEESA